MSAATAPSGHGSAPAAGSGPVVAAVAAVTVGLLTTGTLGTVAAVVAGTALHLLGLSDRWAESAGLLVAAIGLVPAVALARQVWRIERHGPAD